MTTRLEPVAPADIKARRRPLAVLFVYGAELVWALVIATPAHAWARRVWGAHPEGDGVLFRAGGRQLMGWLGQTDAGMGVTTRTTLLLLVLGAVLMQLPLGALLASLAFSRAGESEGATDGRRSLSPIEALRAGIASFMPLAGALALGSIATVVVLAIGAFASAAVDHGFAERLGDASSFQLRLVTFVLFLALAAVAGVVIDLARAAIARESGFAASNGKTSPAWTVMLRGVKVALRASRRQLLPATVAWGWRAAIAVALVGLGAYTAKALGGRDGMALIALFAVHQLIVLARVALRASWLARALSIVAPVQDARDEVPATPTANPALETATSATTTATPVTAKE